MRPLPDRIVLLGHPVTQSASPRFQNAALRAAEIPLTYEALDVEPSRLDAVLAELRDQNAAGNVTIPHKEAVAARCSRLEPLAARCGAVNVFWHEQGALIGDNSDVGGADVTMRALLDQQVAGARVALFGAGGSASAVLCAVERWEGARVVVYNRTVPRAEQLAARFPGLVTIAHSVSELLREAQLVVNATPIGMRDSQHPLPIAALPAGAAVFDLVYRKEETDWVRAAREAGHRAADGEGMLIEQGAIAFTRWFGREPDRDAMWRAMH